MHTDPVFQVEANGIAQYHAFNIPPPPRKFLDAVAMRNRRDPLGDDGALIQTVGDEVRGRADDLDASSERLAIGASTYERR